MSGRLLMTGLITAALIFGAALWWAQTRGWYREVTGVEAITIAGVRTPVAGYRGVDAASSPLKLRGCFLVEDVEGAPANDPEPLVAPGWFDCFDARAIAADLAAGDARAVLAERGAPAGFDRIVAVYPDGRAFEWRQINECGAARFDGNPLSEACAEESE